MKPRKAKTIYGETYTPVVMQVVESDHRGPRVFRRVHDDEQVTLQDDMAFWVDELPLLARTLDRVRRRRAQVHNEALSVTGSAATFAYDEFRRGEMAAYEVVGHMLEDLIEVEKIRTSEVAYEAVRDVLGGLPGNEGVDPGPCPSVTPGGEGRNTFCCLRAGHEGLHESRDGNTAWGGATKAEPQAAGLTKGDGIRSAYRVENAPKACGEPMLFGKNCELVSGHEGDHKAAEICGELVAWVAHPSGTRTYVYCGHPAGHDGRHVGVMSVGQIS